MDPAGSCGSTRSARSAASRRRRSRTSPRSSRRSPRTSPPVSTDSLASCSPRALTLAGRSGRCRQAAVRRDAALGSLGYPLNREPPLLGALAELTAPVVAINPDVAPTDVQSLRRHGVEPVVLGGVGHFLILEDPEQFNPSSSRRWPRSSAEPAGPVGGSTTARRTASRDRRRPRVPRAPGSGSRRRGARPRTMDGRRYKCASILTCARTLGFAIPPLRCRSAIRGTSSSFKGRFAIGIANEAVPDFVPEVHSCGDEPALERGGECSAGSPRRCRSSDTDLNPHERYETAGQDGERPWGFKSPSWVPAMRHSASLASSLGL